jgi:phospholipid/cholesterol/gamma-HCH transport system substrate-binding protein
METRANFLLIGAFTIAGILGILGFFVWLAKYQVDRQYDYYDILFSDVSGLSQAADVRFNGLPVGRVVSLQLAKHDPSLVRVRIEVEDGLPVKADTSAKLQVQGVTGLSYVSLSGGSTDAPLPPEDETGNPTLRAERSIVEQLTEDAPDLLAEGIRLLRDLRRFANSENQSYVSSILRNVDNASGQLETALADFSEISTTVSRATDQVAEFTGQLAPVAASLQRALDQSEPLVRSATAAFDEAQNTLRTSTDTLQTANGALTQADRLIREDAAALLAELNGTAVALRRDLSQLSDSTQGVLGEFATTAKLATARLGELEATLQAIDDVMVEANTTLTDVDTAAIAFEDLVEGEGAELVTESRATLVRVDQALDSINRVLDTDVPAIVADVRSAVATANQVAEEAGSDVTTFTGQFAPLSEDAGQALRAATQTLRTANVTLADFDALMEGAGQTLASAQSTFAALNGILETDARPAAEELRQSAERVGNAVEQMAADLPAAVADLRSVTADASAAMARIGGIVDTTAGPLTSFAQSGLPEFTLFARELRELIERLDRIAGQLERDPARFILGGQAPEYRR